MANRYWLTPPDVYKALDEEFHFDFDTCPYPRYEGYNSLVIPWGRMNYCNPPFRKTNGNTNGATDFVRKALEQQKKGRSTVMLLPARALLNLLLDAGAELRSAGRTRFLEVDTKLPWSSPCSTIIAVLRGIQ